MRPGGKEMRARDKFKYGAVGATLALSTTALLFTTGVGQAAVNAASSVLVTNKGAAQAVPVQQQGTAKTSVTNSVGTYPTVAAASALNLNVGTRNYVPSLNSVGELIQPTQANIDLTALTVTVGKLFNFDPWVVSVDILTVPNGTTAGSCWSARTQDRPLQTFDLFPGTTATVSPVSPLVFAPPPGSTRCLVVIAYNDGGTSSNNNGIATVSATGYVVSGTYSGPHGTN
jgi:hypothetical protein